MASSSHVTESSEADGPPQPPAARRRIHLQASHLPVLLGLLLVVVLAAFGFFGETRGTVEARGSTLELTVDYPTRFRYKQINPMRVYVRNLTAQAMDTVAVEFDSSYIDPFSNVTFTPSATEVWVVQLMNLKPGERRRVQVGLQAEQYGRHRGQVKAAAGPDTAQVEVSTLTFP